jgi:hypothetical protein
MIKNIPKDIALFLASGEKSQTGSGSGDHTSELKIAEIYFILSLTISSYGQN